MTSQVIIIKLHCVLVQHLILSPHFPPKVCTNPYFIEKSRCLSSVSLFFCRKAVGLLTSSPLPSFLLSEGTHLKNENKVIVPVLFLKSLQMLSVDRRLIVRAVCVWAGGRERRYRYNSSSCKQHSSHSITENTLFLTQLVSLTHKLHCSLTQTHLHGTDWHIRRSFSFNGLFGMHGVVTYMLGSLQRAP